LVHGIWGGPEAWKAFKNKLNDKGQYTTLEANYKKLSATNFAESFPVIPVTIGKLLEKAKKQHIVANKVDIVVHSMGGLVTREYCRQEPDACKKNIHKLITIDTPHYGSELADWLLLHKVEPVAFHNLTLKIDDSEKKQQKQRDTCNRQIQKFVDGDTFLGQDIPPHPIPDPAMSSAVASLATGTVSDPVLKGAWGALPTIANEVPMHLIVGQLPSVLPSSPSMWWLKNKLLEKCNLSWDRVFSGEASDGVVRIGSQSDGLGVQYQTSIRGVDHLDVTDEGEVVERVRVLLEGDMSLFSPAGR
jgi:pimeloyl-ACP methyl ester carboxylesterase